MATKYGENLAPVEQQAVLAQGDQTKLLPSNVQENPSLAVGEDQAFLVAVDEQVQTIMSFFFAVLPSNYTSQINGPFYTMQFQAAAEQIARIQVQASEIFADSEYDFTRPEFLYQILGVLVFPDVVTDGFPTLPSDIALRKFLKDMTGILLQGATKSAIYEALKLLTSADVQIIEKAIEARSTPGTAYTLADQFEFEITVSKTVRTTITSDTGVPPLPAHYHTLSVNPSTGSGLTLETVWTGDTVGIDHIHDIYGWLVQPYVATATIPSHFHDVVSDLPDVDPLALLRNVALVLKALKPAHTLYEYRNLFREVWRTLATDSQTLNLNSAYYDDLRKYWWGAARLTGTVGETLADRTLFSDPTRSFARISIGAALTILSGPNAVSASNTDQNTVGRYTVTDILTFPVPSDTSVVLFTTIPTGLNGHLQITGTNTLQAMVFDVATNQYIPDTAFNWVGIEENEILFIAEGVNEGNYRFDALLGNNGGPVLTAVGPAYQARMAPSLLRLDRRMRFSASLQQYEVVVDRLGVLTPTAVVNEDVSAYFASVPSPLPPVTPAVNPDFLFGSLTEPVVGDIYRSAFLTQNGPLVKDWGDMTMATKNDVTVTVNGVPVAVDSVNPYTGRINLVTPIQITPAPMMPWVVEVSYNWMPKAITDIGALNTVGLVLNQWDRSINHDNPSGNPVQLGAVSNGSRFQLGLELGPIADQEPLYIGWRYLGLERGYTAALNDPTSLLLNQNPNAVSTNKFEVEPEPVSVSYEGTTFPTLGNWALVGQDSGTLIGNGTYEVKADNIGPFLTGKPALYYQMADLTLPSTSRVVVRLALDPATVTPTGVFTGITFGAHDNRKAYIVGFLLLPPLGTGVAFRSIGFLLDPARPDLRASWQVGPQIISSPTFQQVTATAQNKLSVLTAAMPQNVKAGTRFYIESGPQQGIYTVASAVAQTGREKQVGGGKVGFVAQMQKDVLLGTPLVSGSYRVELSFDPTGPSGYTVNNTSTGFTIVLTGTTGYTGTVTYKVFQSLATTTVTLTSNLPADINAVGGKYPTLLWEVDYKVASTYALTISTASQGATVYCSGPLFGTFLTATASTPLAQPAQVGPLGFGYAGG